MLDLFVGNGAAAAANNGPVTKGNGKAGPTTLLKFLCLLIGLNLYNLVVYSESTYTHIYILIYLVLWEEPLFYELLW